MLIADTAFRDTVLTAPGVDRDIEVIDIRDVALGDLPAVGKMDYESFIATGTPDYDWHLPKDEWQAPTPSYTSVRQADLRSCLSPWVILDELWYGGSVAIAPAPNLSLYRADVPLYQLRGRWL